MSVLWPNGSTQMPRVTDEWGWRPDKPVPGVNPFHNGIDLVGWAINKSPVAGQVIFARYNGSAGNQISVRGNNGDVFVIMHNARFLVWEGQWVAQGQDLGVMGTTGASTGVHCHFEIRPGGGNSVNPRNYMAAANSGTAGGGFKPLPKLEGDNMLLPIIVQNSKGYGDLFTIGQEYLKYETDYNNAVFTRNVLTPDDKFVPVSAKQFAGILASFGVPSNVPNILINGSVRVWSRQREVNDKLDKLLAAQTPAK